MKKYVILRGVIEENWGNRFFSLTDGRDPTKLNDGRTAYEVIGYADTMAEAQIKLYGKSYTNGTD